MASIEIVRNYVQVYFAKSIAIHNPNTTEVQLLEAYGAVVECLEEFYNNHENEQNYIISLPFELTLGNKNYSLSLPSGAIFIFDDILNNLNICFNSTNIGSLSIFEIQANILLSFNIPIYIKVIYHIQFVQKLNEIINLVISTDHEVIDTYYKAAFSLTNESYTNRENLKKELIKNVELQILPEVRELTLKFDDITKDAVCYMANKIIARYIKFEKFEDCCNFLINNIHSDQDNLADFFLGCLLRVNDLFTIIRSQDIYDIYVANKHKINKTDYYDIKVWLYPIKVKSLYLQTSYKGQQNLGITAPSITNDNTGGVMLGINPSPLSEFPARDRFYSLDNIDTTVFQFTLPSKISATNAYSIKEGIKFIFHTVDHFTEHPLYYLQGRAILGGNTLGHMIDIYPGQGQVTFVEAFLDECYHPEFHIEFSDGKLETTDIDFTEERAIYGASYFPSKSRVVKALREVLLGNEVAPTFSQNDINLDLFSCLRVLLYNSRDKVVILERTYFLTSDYLYNKRTSSYIEKLNELNILGNDFVEAFKGYKIYNNHDLLNFVTFIFNQTVANQITHKSGYKYFWLDSESEKEPKNEPLVQPYLMNIIEPLCTLKGVGVVREPASSEGEIDMLFTYTNSQNKLLKVCCEIKKAHHKHADSAAGTQLKRYLDSQQTKFGIYLLLWFKYSDNNKFSDPKKHVSISAMRTVIDANKPSGYTINSLIIDCTKPIYPSLER
ncbi:hypothetical protein SAMN06265337_0621 [Hymenobacter gelipurpurascens]|uniref:PD-(D/E)XK nuclease superfamily protein n=1 Tax=Hymenobacter gelipurpurascens TaxID=89968 RepID=A0A212T8L9_9BACT|nr:hypothetical protein [Hymenobacter gelipurpurascens]SNC62191.1 hypothetical protein SAMN06265337_0621 [Hymenobacter gelipurpurascens]